MTKHGRRVATGGPTGHPPKTVKGANATVARIAKAVRRLEEIEKREAACAEAEATLAARKEELNAMEAALAKRLATLEALEQAREQGRVSNADASSKLSPVALEFLEDSVESLRPKTGELTTPHESRIILMLYFDLVKRGSSENKAKDQVAKTFRIGTAKVLAVCTLWYDKQELYQTTGKGRGKASSASRRG
ncbi:unnamed protein product [Ectocarpus sp. 6 AP-2014]